MLLSLILSAIVIIRVNSRARVTFIPYYSYDAKFIHLYASSRTWDSLSEARSEVIYSLNDVMWKQMSAKDWVDPESEIYIKPGHSYACAPDWQWDRHGGSHELLSIDDLRDILAYQGIGENAARKKAKRPHFRGTIYIFSCQSGENARAITPTHVAPPHVQLHPVPKDSRTQFHYCDSLAKKLNDAIGSDHNYKSQIHGFIGNLQQELVAPRGLDRIMARNNPAKAKILGKIGATDRKMGKKGGINYAVLYTEAMVVVMAEKNNKLVRPTGRLKIHALRKRYHEGRRMITERRRLIDATPIKHSVKTSAFIPVEPSDNYNNLFLIDSVSNWESNGEDIGLVEYKSGKIPADVKNVYIVGGVFSPNKLGWAGDEESKPITAELIAKRLKESDLAAAYNGKITCYGDYSSGFAQELAKELPKQGFTGGATVIGYETNVDFVYSQKPGEKTLTRKGWSVDKTTKKVTYSDLPTLEKTFTAEKSGKAHQSYDNLISNAENDFYNLLADYEYDVAVEDAREKRASVLIKKEKHKVKRAAASVKKIKRGQYS